MTEINILIIEDDLEINRLISRYLSNEGYSTTSACNGLEAANLLSSKPWHMVILDLMLPYMDGYEVLRKIRGNGDVPVLILSAKTENMDKIIGLGLGADDYLTKPFQIEELLARVKAHIRRYLYFGSKGLPAECILRHMDLEMNIENHEVKISGKPVMLTAKEFDILKLLLSSPKRVFTKAQVFNAVWGEEYLGDENTVMVHIRRLREKIEPDPSNPHISRQFGESDISWQRCSMGMIVGILLAAVCLWLLYRHYVTIRGMNTLVQVLDDICQGNTSRRILLSSPADGQLKHLISRFNGFMDQYEHINTAKHNLELTQKRMLSDISHDIRTPLTSMLGYIDALQKDKGLSEVEKSSYLDIVAAKSQSLYAMVQDFFEMAKLESEDLPVEFRKIDLVEKTREILVGFYHDFVRLDLTPHLQLPEKPLYVSADPVLLERILQNLLSNSLRHGMEGKVLGVSIWEEQDKIRAEVWDRGQGISPRDLPYVFERLYMADPSRNRELRGSGLGLAITRKLVEKLKGEITVHSVPGEKTAFSFYLPRWE